MSNEKTIQTLPQNATAKIKNLIPLGKDVIAEEKKRQEVIDHLSSSSVRVSTRTSVEMIGDMIHMQNVLGFHQDPDNPDKMTSEIVAGDCFYWIKDAHKLFR